MENNNTNIGSTTTQIDFYTTQIDSNTVQIDSNAVQIDSKAAQIDSKAAHAKSYETHMTDKNEKIKTIIGICLFAAFMTLFIVGFNNGEVMTVLTKAVNICLECIGIG